MTAIVAYCREHRLTPPADGATVIARVLGQEAAVLFPPQEQINQQEETHVTG